MSRATRETQPAIKPADASVFHAVTQALKRKGRAAGWTHARDLLLDHFPTFSDSWGGAVAMKMALEIDRHAMLAETHAKATRTEDMAKIWAEYQRFLRGEVAEPPQRPGVSQAQTLEARGTDEDARLGEEEDA